MENSSKDASFDGGNESHTHNTTAQSVALHGSSYQLSSAQENRLIWDPLPYDQWPPRKPEQERHLVRIPAEELVMQGSRKEDPEHI